MEGRSPPPDEAQRRLEQLRHRRRDRREAERRRRAAIRRRRALLAAALASACLGAVLGGRANNPGPPGPKLVHSRRPVPVLMYHVVAAAPEGAANSQLFVKPLRFRAEMDFLASKGYTAVALGQVYEAWQSDGLLPVKPIVVSFDDGYRGDYTDALPILSERDWPGVLNLELGALANGELTDEMIEAMLDAGWELDSHTVNHLDLTELKGSDLTTEVAGSRELLQKRFGVPVDFFCYPAGRFNPRAVRAVRTAGYLGATTTQPGLAAREQLFKLRRIRVQGSDGVPDLAEKLRMAGR